MSLNKKAPAFADAFLVEHLEKSSPLIVEEVRRWRELLWDDWINYKRGKERNKMLAIP